MLKAHEPAPTKGLGLLSALDVVESYLEAFSAGDLALTSGHLSEDVVLVTPEGTFGGRTAVTDEIEGMLDGMFAPGTYTRHVDCLVCRDGVVLLVWHAVCLGTDVLRAASTFVVRGERIAIMTAAGWTDPV